MGHRVLGVVCGHRVLGVLCVGIGCWVVCVGAQGAGCGVWGHRVKCCVGPVTFLPSCLLLPANTAGHHLQHAEYAMNAQELEY